MTQKKKILFISHMSSFFNEQIGIIKMCLKNNITPIVQFVCPLHTTLKGISTCLELGIETYDTNGELIKSIDDIKIPAPPQPTVNNIQQRKNLRQKFREFKSSPIVNWSNLKNRFEMRRTVMRKFLSEIKPDLIVLGGDLVGHDTCICIQEAHNFGLKVVTLTLVMASGDDPANFFTNKDEFKLKNPINWITGLIFRKWVYKFKNKKYLRLPASYVWYYILNKLEPPLPWVFNSGDSDTLL